MKRQVTIRPEAEADIEESFNWYEDQVSGVSDMNFDIPFAQS
ncbi:MAG: hypothetical protein ACRD6X_03460 [Pyrinomonadaceae bacterium]